MGDRQKDMFAKKGANAPFSSVRSDFKGYRSHFPIFARIRQDIDPV
ncbi:hypothetical protein LS684_16295 [Cytobacillus spongiae]|nr:hypothetical protein [Cytobacillus spongiae]UII55199.1 hypothetical protein LS684_16295 [Cytobacillus spongiae]